MLSYVGTIDNIFYIKNELFIPVVSSRLFFHKNTLSFSQFFNIHRLRPLWFEQTWIMRIQHLVQLFLKRRHVNFDWKSHAVHLLWQRPEKITHFEFFFSKSVKLGQNQRTWIFFFLKSALNFRPRLTHFEN